MFHRLLGFTLLLLCVLLVLMTPSFAAFAQDTTPPADAPAGIVFSDDTISAVFVAVLLVFGGLASYALHQQGKTTADVANMLPLPIAQAVFGFLLQQARSTASPDDDKQLIDLAIKFGWSAYPVGEDGNYVLTKPASPSRDSPTGM